jgi:hypothetical protein
LIDAPHGKEFVFQDGTRAKNVSELTTAIASLSDHGFHHFVNLHKNDFATWIDHVLEDKKLSDELRKCKTKKDALKLLDTHVKKFSKTSKNDSIRKFSILNMFKFKNKTIDTGNAKKEESKNNVNQESKKHIVEEPLKHDKKHEVNEIHDFHRVEHPKNSEVDVGILKEKKSEDKIDKSEGMKSSRKWFQIYIKKNKISEKELLLKDNKAIHTQKDKNDTRERQFTVETLSSEKESGKSIGVNGSDAHENSLWVILYISLVVLIITLLVYKLFLQ